MTPFTCDLHDSPSCRLPTCSPVRADIERLTLMAHRPTDPELHAIEELLQERRAERDEYVARYGDHL